MHKRFDPMNAERSRNLLRQIMVPEKVDYAKFADESEESEEESEEDDDDDDESDFE